MQFHMIYKVEIPTFEIIHTSNFVRIRPGPGLIEVYRTSKQWRIFLGQLFPQTAVAPL